MVGTGDQHWVDWLYHLIIVYCLDGEVVHGGGGFGVVDTGLGVGLEALLQVLFSVHLLLELFGLGLSDLT